MSNEVAKRAAGYHAVQFVKSGMVVGLGTGSTALFFIEALSAACKRGLRIHVVASSEDSAHLAKKLELPFANLDKIDLIDLTADGADEIDPQFNMIKGGGGALLREKIVAHASREMIVLIDSSKQVAHLGSRALPIEVATFGHHFTQQSIESMGLKGAFRLDSSGKLFITDNGNLIFDLAPLGKIKDPHLLERRLQAIPGVLETGLFLGVAKRMIVGYGDGRVEIVDPVA